MATNFRIITSRENNALHLNLRGDFDGMSAMELVCTITDNVAWAKKIYIQTDGLKSLLFFGCDLFQKKIALCGDASKKIIVMGAHSSGLCPNSK